jgi:hypothetical protein
MSPEEVDERVELYVLGLILYEILTGRTSFRSTTSGDQTYFCLTGEKILPINPEHEVAKWHGIEELVLSVLASNCELAPASAIALSNRLDAIRTPVPQAIT